MYLNQAVQQGPTSAPIDQAQTVGSIQKSTIAHLVEAQKSLSDLLTKFRGPQPEDNSKVPEEMPSLMAMSHKIETLALSIVYRCNELHQIIGQ